MATVRMDDVRQALRELSEGGAKEVSTAMVLDALGITDSKERDVTRRQLNHLVKRNEAIRVKWGVYRYNPKAAPARTGEGYQRIWRAIRAQKNGWTYQDIALVTRYSYAFVRKYCGFLLDQGYIERFGKKGAALQLRTTLKGREQRETPFPPKEINDPFEKEKKAALRLVRVFFESDLRSPRAQEKIVSSCEVLLNCFKKEV